jgi:flagellar hook assembly protein FlgD
MFFDVPGHVGPVSLGIYNASGQLVKRLVERAVERGRHPASWDGTDDLGRKLSAGVYFIRLEADGRQATRKVVVLR